MEKAIKKGRLVYLPKQKKYARVLDRKINSVIVKTIPDGDIIEVVEKGLLLVKLAKFIWEFIKGIFKKHED